MTSVVRLVRMGTFLGFNSLYPCVGFWFIINVVLLYSHQSMLTYEMGPSFRPTVVWFALTAALVFCISILGAFVYFLDKRILYLMVSGFKKIDYFANQQC